MTFPIGTGDIAPLLDGLESMIPGYSTFLIYVGISLLVLSGVILAVRAGLGAARAGVSYLFGRRRRRR